MKRIAALLLALALMFSVTGCGKKSTCPMCDAKADFSTQIFCSNCGYDFGSMKPDGYYEEQPTPEELAIYELAGTWESANYIEEYQESGILNYELLSLETDGSGSLYSKYTNDFADYTDTEIISLSFSVDDCVLTLSDLTGEWVEDEWFNYKIENNTLFLDDAQYIRIPSNTAGEIIGSWEAVISAAKIEIDLCTHTVWRLDLYQDGTYQFNGGEYSSYAVNSSGYYQIIHDGSAIVFDGDINSPFPIKMLSNEVMIITDESYYGDMLFKYIGSN